MKKPSEYMFANFNYPGQQKPAMPDGIVKLASDAQAAGGPAFPVSIPAGEGQLNFFGKTLRYSFAEAALQGLLANTTEIKIDGGMDQVLKHYAKTAYDYADPMLAERDKG